MRWHRCSCSCRRLTWYFPERRRDRSSFGCLVRTYSLISREVRVCKIEDFYAGDIFFSERDILILLRVRLYCSTLSKWRACFSLVTAIIITSIATRTTIAIISIITDALLLFHNSFRALATARVPLCFFPCGEM